MKRELRGAMAALFTCTDREVLVEGRAGTAKTTGILTKILYCLRRYPGCRVLFVRQTRESLTDSVLVTWERLLGEHHPEVQRVKRTQRHSYRLYGSEVVCGGLDKPKKLFSTEWDIIYANEAVEISQEPWELFGRAMRHCKMPYQQRIADCNPDYPGHWLNKRAFPCDDKYRDADTRKRYDRLQAYNHGPQLDPATGKPWRMRRLVSVHQDNPGYWDMGAWDWTPQGRAYVEGELGAMTGAAAERMKRGRWVAATGTVFPEFNEARHTIRPFPIPASWPVFLGWDPGYDHPTAIIWIACAPNGCLYVIDEIYQGGLEVREHCRNVHARNRGRTVRRSYADPQHAFSSTAQSPKSIATQAAKHGIKLSPWPRSTDVEAMVNAVRELLTDGRLKVFTTCTNTIDEFQAWRYKRNARGEPLQGDDAFEDANNHAMDCIKGLVACGIDRPTAGGRATTAEEMEHAAG